MSLLTFYFGRVKTLHPKVFGGILNRQDNESDVQQMIELTFHKLT
jgi:phosphoribosylaminoimidazolecarboxamide formyltransferase/IMP cyclohydrolase